MRCLCQVLRNSKVIAIGAKMGATRRAFLAATASCATWLKGTGTVSAENSQSQPGTPTFPSLSVFDAYAEIGQTRVFVPVRRAEPTLYTCTVQVKLGWPEDYPELPSGTDVRDIVFPWDVDEVLVPFDLPQKFSSSSKLRAVLQTPRVYGANEVRISGRPSYVSARQPTTLPLVKRSIVDGEYPRARPPAEYRETFFSNLIDGFEATDSGLTAAGTPCWKSQLGHGRTQNNGEVGIATDPVLHAEYGARPWIIEDGKRVLQAQKLQRPILYKNKRWVYSSPVLTTERLFRTGYGWIEARLSFDGAQGSWPAFWMKCSPHWIWPPEQDILEWSFSKPNPKASMPFFTQWWREGQSAVSAGSFANVWEILPGFTQNEPHTYALHWREHVQEWFIDGILVHSQPSRNHIGQIDGADEDGRMYLKLNVAVGGQAGMPNDDKFPAKLRIEHVRVLQPS